jgi:hypothetical protein
MVRGSEGAFARGRDVLNGALSFTEARKGLMGLDNEGRLT